MYKLLILIMSLCIGCASCGGGRDEDDFPQQSTQPINCSQPTEQCK